MGRFDGSWRVHEHVFSPDGEYLGRVVQTRRLERRDDDRVRVIQDCEPEPRLEGSPMARFRGHHEFDLVVDGRLRIYRGPAVLGTGVPLGEGAMVGRGVWPDFGYSFTSYAAMVSPRRQLTGGTFCLANRPVAVIVGEAGPHNDDEAATDGASDVSQPLWPGELGKRWRGHRRRFDASGAVVDVADGDRECIREYVAGGFRDSDDSSDGGDSFVAVEPWAGGYRVARGEGRDRAVGTAMRYGCALFIDLTGTRSGQPESQEWLELLDPASRTLTSIRRVFRAQQIDHIELCEMKVEQEPA